ncbi:MAG: putative rRNA maturation factor [Candidatus Aldehydirespiratoraceae bacterium]|jgi:probable rRNA maturation factor
MADRPVVVAVDEQTAVAIDLDRWQRLATDALVASEVHVGELNLLFVEEAEMRELNLQHMDEDRPTDVLSFPLDGADGDPLGDDLIGAILIGDIVVCPAYALRQAEEHAGDRTHDGSVDDELALLIVHGVLHVLGHDHAEPDETALMQRCEDELLTAYHLPHRTEQ